MGKIAEFPKSAALGESAFKAMVANGVEPSPQNYAVWFTYVSGLQPELTRIIDARIADREVFTNSYSSELYERFCDGGRHFSVLQKTSAELDMAVERVVKVIAAAAGDAKNFNKTLDEFSHDLDD
jgi:diguanylate cyclase